jgi:hypothetical protein
MAAARIVTLGAALALVLPSALASSGAEYRALRARDYQIPDTIPLESRQDISPEKFQCHSDCGTFILDAEASGCEDEAWQGLLESCLECVGEFPIWQHYSAPVQAAADACGLEATPTAVAVETEVVSTSTGAPTATGTASGDEQEASSSPTVTSSPTETAPSASASDVSSQ